MHGEDLGLNLSGGITRNIADPYARQKVSWKVELETPLARQRAIHFYIRRRGVFTFSIDMAMESNCKSACRGCRPLAVRDRRNTRWNCVRVIQRYVLWDRCTLCVLIDSRWRRSVSSEWPVPSEACRRDSTAQGFRTRIQRQSKDTWRDRRIENFIHHATFVLAKDAIYHSRKFDISK